MIELGFIRTKSFWLTNWLVFSRLMWLWPFKMPTQNFLMLLVLLRLMLENVLTTVRSRFWSWILIKSSKLKFGQYFGADVWLSFWSRLWSWILINLLWLKSKYFGKSTNPWVRCAFGNIFIKNCCRSTIRISLLKKFATGARFLPNKWVDLLVALLARLQK